MWSVHSWVLSNLGTSVLVTHIKLSRLTSCKLRHKHAETVQHVPCLIEREYLTGNSGDKEKVLWEAKLDVIYTRPTSGGRGGETITSPIATGPSHIISLGSSCQLSYQNRFIAPIPYQPHLPPLSPFKEFTRLEWNRQRRGTRWWDRGGERDDDQKREDWERWMEWQWACQSSRRGVMTWYFPEASVSHYLLLRWKQTDILNSSKRFVLFFCCRPNACWQLSLYEKIGMPHIANRLALTS